VRTNLSAAARGSLSYRALRLVLVHAKRLFSRSCSAHPTHPKVREDARVRHRATRVTRCERSWGESRFTTRSSLRRPSERSTRALCSLDRDRSDRLWHPCRLLLARKHESRCRELPLWLEGRQDRFRGGLVTGVRFPDPRCLPSPETPSNPPAPRRGRTYVPWSIARRSRDEDRRVSTSRLPFTRCRTLRLRARCVLLAEPPFTTLRSDQAFDPLVSGGVLLWARRRSTDFCKPCDARALTASVPVPRMRQ